jgi:hypothetical protein
MTPVHTIRENWAYNFTECQDELKTCFSYLYNYQRAKYEDLKTMSVWFNHVQVTRMQYRIADKDIYNFDKTGFAMGLVATAKVVTRSKRDSCLFLVYPGNREWVTSIKYINSMGWALPPCIIFKGNIIIHG